MRSLLSFLRRLRQGLRAHLTPRKPPAAPHALAVQLLAQDCAAQVARVFVEPSDPYYAAALAAQQVGSISVYVAWLHEGLTQPVGIAYVHWPGHRNLQVRARMPGIPEIYKVQVARSQRSRGIGALLITQVEQAMRAHGLAHASLGVHATNHRARALYARLGYTADATTYDDEYDELDLQGKLQHHCIASVLMVKPL
jgi:ribosomal protein S18 acetylase RimI-like enzyme